jgi:hypothetical protein
MKRPYPHRGRSRAWAALPRAILASTLLLCASAHAQFTPTAVESAPTLPAMVAQLGAQAAQPSTHLLLDAPDVTLAGPVTIRMKSELPGTSLLLLARGQFIASTNPAAAEPPRAAPPALAARSHTEAPFRKLPPTVWIASRPIKAGQTAVDRTVVTVDKTTQLTLFVQAQGRWWFVSREIKVGQPHPSPRERGKSSAPIRP